ncbi:hypothetical protein [Ferrimicrobium sp.]|uniref:hypothetical protein n=1 Tax=Ferrimicrobium sp. TaxID=2926050 RepID=UPI002632FE4D|nr:hypothetical protein [Ferrimicrobium sp.]
MAPNLVLLAVVLSTNDLGFAAWAITPWVGTLRVMLDYLPRLWCSGREAYRQPPMVLLFAAATLDNQGVVASCVVW